MRQFTQELFEKVPPHAVLTDLLHVSVRPDGETILSCFRAEIHTRQDRHRSATANGGTGLYHCFACGKGFDVVTLAVALGHARDRVAAIHWLREKYRLPRARRSWRSAVESRTGPDATAPRGRSLTDGTVRP
jgi:hypothetical protein